MCNPVAKTNNFCMSAALYCVARWPAVTDIFVTIRLLVSEADRKTEQSHFLHSSPAGVREHKPPYLL